MIASVPISIVLPVYGRQELLPKALDSLLKLENSQWQLVIADDGSDQQTKRLIARWIDKNQDVNTKWSQRNENLGLFANLNLAMKEINTEWVTILCSDDVLKPNAISTILECQKKWPQAKLILSTFESINSDGSSRPPDNKEHHDRISGSTKLIPAETFIPALLEHGSINGNITGMTFSKTLWGKCGPFRAKWRHAADWEWLLRAAEKGPILLNRESIAKVRTHNGQLSNQNRKSGHEITEVGEVVNLLRQHRLISTNPNRDLWSARIMQHQLWNVLKGIPKGNIQNIPQNLTIIHKSAGLRLVFIHMIKRLVKNAPSKITRIIR